MIKLKEKLKNLIDSYKEVGADYIEQLRATLLSFNDEDVKRTYTTQGVADLIAEAKAEVLGEWDNVSTVFNQKAKMIVAEAKETLANEIMNPGEKPADYAIKVNNAFQFIQLEDAESLNDDVAYSILKDFVNDYEQMKLFKRQIEKKGVLVSAGDSFNYYPKTFGQFGKVERVLASFDSLDAVIEGIFTYRKQDSNDTVYAGNAVHSMPMDGYTEIVGWDEALKYSGDIEHLISKY